MEIGQKPVNQLILVTRIEERIGHALLRFQESICIGNRLDHTRTRCTDRHDAAAFALCLVDDVGIFLGEFVVFAMHLVLRKVFDGDVLECTRPYMERHFGNIDTLRLKVIEHLFAKVEASRRSSHGTGILCKNRLVSLLVFFVIGAVDVRWQRYMAFPVHDFFHFGRSLFETKNAVTVFFMNFFDMRTHASKRKFTPHLERLTRMHLRLETSLARFGRV